MAAVDPADLAHRATSGDLTARDLLVRELQPMVVRTVRLIVGSGSSAAEDAAQDALGDIVRGLPALRDPDAVWSWSYRIATRRAIRVARQERLLGGLLERGVETGGPPVLDPDLLPLREAFRRLPPKMRAVAVLRLYCGLTEQEVALVLGSAVGTVKSQLSQARARLRADLKPEG